MPAKPPAATRQALLNIWKDGRLWTGTRLGAYHITCGAVRDQFEQIRPELVKILTSFVFEDYGQ
jgi:hypothetical protein